MRVSGALEGLPCIHQVAVDVDRGQVTVGFDADRCTPQDVVERLRSKGYETGEALDLAAPPRTPGEE